MLLSIYYVVTIYYYRGPLAVACDAAATAAMGLRVPRLTICKYQVGSFYGTSYSDDRDSDH